MVPSASPTTPATPDRNVDIVAESHLSTGTHSLPTSPHILIHQAVEAHERPSLAPHLSAPPAISKFQSPLRHHKRTPSQHREVKETLNARTEWTKEDADGRSQQTINQYIIKEEIGRGSYGAVHLATDQYGTEYALKEFSKARLRKRAQSHILRRPDGADRPQQLAPGRGRWMAHKKQLSSHEAAEAKDALYLIREEVAVMKKLNHPNLAALIEVLDDPEEDSLYMVLEMCKKGVVMKVGLDEHADPYDDDLCRCWFRDLILGIEYLHNQGIIHRDIKPENLLLTEDDVLKIVDFGVSEMFEKPDVMMTSKSAGSPAFLPPELCQAKHGDVSGKAADVWSMGVSLYCLKYGRLPFKRDNVLEMYDAIRTEELYIPPKEDEDFADLITRILDKNNQSRITLPEIRNHPWVTKRGSDLLLSEEENCGNVVETPNELEVNHAFTQKMDHLLCVFKAIQRFKGLISNSRSSTPRTPQTPQLVEEPAPTLEKSISADTDSTTTTRPRHKSIAEEAAELVEQRKAFLASKNLQSSASTVPDPSLAAQHDRGHAQDPTERAPLFLGIGTGGYDEFGNSHSAPASTGENTVSDSPTGIDFDVYDRAFETEIRRIRSDKKKGGRAKTYLTRLVGEKEVDKYAGDDCMVLEAGKTLASTAYGSGSSAAEMASRGLGKIHGWGSSYYHGQGGAEPASRNGDDNVGGGARVGMRETLVTKRQESQEEAKKVVDSAREKGHKFADLVASMRKSGV
ncbi:Pkinase-domain-containing protein [Xylariomycetidae sp. FL2044]|nr:Pkinase-domain-containing protein [Xylariomycetidae sp. FL2044]